MVAVMELVFKSTELMVVLFVGGGGDEVGGGDGW